MTDDEARALGERWIRAGGRWRPGMLSGGPVRLRGLASYATGYRFDAIPHPDLIDTSRAWPDLRDPATRGTALAVVRERYPDAYLMPLWADLACTQRVWCLFFGSRVRAIGRGATEAEALVSALESKESA